VATAYAVEAGKAKRCFLPAGLQKGESNKGSFGGNDGSKVQGNFLGHVKGEKKGGGSLLEKRVGGEFNRRRRGISKYY